MIVINDTQLYSVGNYQMFIDLSWEYFATMHHKNYFRLLEVVVQTDKHFQN